MASNAVYIVWLVILLKININAGQLIEGKAKPAYYISFPPSTYDEGSYSVSHNIGNCTSRVEMVDNHNEDVIMCPYGELLLDGVKEADFGDSISNNDIQHFYTWQESSIPSNEAFITLQFPSTMIMPSKVVVYCLESRDLDVRKPRQITLYYSTTESIFPTNEIQDIDDNVDTIINQGTTANNDEYIYRRFDLIIPENRRVPLNYLRISCDFERMNWIFISEIEIYHMTNVTAQPTITSTALSSLPPSMTTIAHAPITVSLTSSSSPSISITTSASAPTTVLMTSSSTSISMTTLATTPTTVLMSHFSTSISMTTSASAPTTVLMSSSSTSISIKTSAFPPTTLITTSAVLLSSSSVLPLTTASTPTTFATPVFVFPTDNPFLLHLKKTPIDVTINCTVAWEGDVSNLTTSWSYNEVNISTSDKYLVADNHLTIKEFTPKDVGLYRCMVQHQNGWSDSRKYFISANRGAAQDSSGSSSDLPILIIAAAAGGGIGLLLCIIITICCAIVCLRQRKTAEDNESLGMDTLTSLHVGNGTLNKPRKLSVDNLYEQINPRQIDRHGNPTTLSTIFRQPTIDELPKPQLPRVEINKEDTYGILESYIAMNKAVCPSFSPTNDDETCFNIYDQTSHFNTTQSPQDVYCKAFSNGQNPMYGSTMDMCVPIYDDPRPLAENEAPRLIEWNDISLLTNIGQGQFGDVFLAETVDIDVGYVDTKATKVLVAIKTLKGDCNADLKEYFEKEIKFMARLNNNNVIKLLGICNKGTPFIMMEYMKNGDLLMFLRKHYHPEIGKDITTAEIQVDIPILLYIALQIANGMRYLASYGFIHRDLAARNCLVGEDYVVKVADFGMTQDLYNSSYFVMQGSAIVPIRWMAPESFYGKFSTKTDVWSYGVTMWEVFTLCRQQPYHEMTDEALLHDVQKECKRTLLKRPPIAPDEVYSIMKQCWTYDSSQRPDFDLLYEQLFTFYMYIQ